MRAIFGVVSLLVVLAIVGLLAAKQLKSGAVSVSSTAVESGAAKPADGGTAAAAPAPLTGTPAQQSQQLQQRVQGDVAKAFDAAADARKEAADK